jgi:hypothetical protein
MNAGQNEAAAALANEYLRDTISRFRFTKNLGDGALAQISEEHLHLAPDAESNSVAVIVKHLWGNMRSRWTDFLTTDGEKPDRHRDTEFEDDQPSKTLVLERWQEGRACLLGALESLGPADVLRTVTIRAEPLTALSAIQRQLAHVSYHVGQIVYLAKLFRGTQWQSLSVPRGQSEQFNQTMLEKARSTETS